MRLRDDYTQDCVKGLLRWNKIISTAGYDFKLSLPNVAFHRAIGEFRDIHATPDGVLIDDATWTRRKDDWLPSTADGDFIASLMTPVTEIGSFAPWIAPPQVGIDNKPGDFEYVKIETGGEVRIGSSEWRIGKTIRHSLLPIRCGAPFAPPQ